MRALRSFRRVVLFATLSGTALAGVSASPAGAAGPALRWAPPPLVNPTTITLGQGFTMSELDPAKDYIIKLPPYRKDGAVVIKGGHNVVVEGGYISIPPGQPDDAHMRGIYIKDNVGTVHIEGVAIDGSDGGMSDGIDIASPQSTVQIENVRITGLMGGLHSFHADVIQPWGGVGALRVDRLTGSSNYQGLFIPRDLGDIGSVTLDHVNLSQTPGPYDGGGHMLWITPGIGSCQSYPLSLSDVYVQPRAGMDMAWELWPQRDAWFGCPNVATADGGVTWRTLQVSGEVRPAPSPEGDYVPAGAAGVGYSSPGYLSDPNGLQATASVAPPGGSRTCTPPPCRGATTAPRPTTAAPKRRATARRAPAKCRKTTSRSRKRKSAACTSRGARRKPARAPKRSVRKRKHRR